jgi:hypothetical protein
MMEKCTFHVIPFSEYGDGSPSKQERLENSSFIMYYALIYDK